MHPEPPGFLQTTLVDAALGLDARSPPDDVNGGLRTELHSRSPPSRSRFTDTRHDAQHSFLLLDEMLRMLRSGGVTRCIARACSSAATDAKSSAENTVLSRFIKDKIKVSGPITVHEYMQMCIGSPSVGYYSQFSRQGSEIFGDKGDFITAPELCQMFGEMIGIWCFYELGYTGHRGAWQLVECGPGTGQLMNDVVGVLNMFQEDKVSIHLVETSDSLILEQERTLCAKPSEFIEGLPHVRYNKTRSGMEVYWYRSVDDVPGDKFSVFIANEFLDALPIHQFRRNDKGRWSEVYVNLDSKGELCFMLSKNENLHTKGLIPDSVRDEKSLIEWEISPFSGMFVNQVAERICSHGGFAVLVDYGHDNTRKNLSLRAYHKHGETNPLERCGEQDLTADVNFGHLKSLVEDRTVVYGPVDQREFLAQLGIGLRLRKLVEQLKTRDEQEALIKSYNMLMSEEGMGTKFKAMAMYPQTLKNILEKRGGPVGFASSKRNLKEETTK
ncbi:hypothetical protein QR680_012631 [Steinernema hermaphroditum]|uniref:Protein arginine methyltransferase NDUFAF7 n=1 Tax=Steinernema hermaphroditum TaxID=289476 RepID=A0AA39I3Z0_9BILA|nr:hypothetical protein QR680_012631 [Steinernema hermaphroditum]